MCCLGVDELLQFSKTDAENVDGLLIELFIMLLLWLIDLQQKCRQLSKALKTLNQNALILLSLVLCLLVHCRQLNRYLVVISTLTFKLL